MLVWKILMVAAIAVFSGAIALILDDVANERAGFVNGVVITVFIGIVLGLSILLVSL